MRSDFLHYILDGLRPCWESQAHAREELGRQLFGLGHEAQPDRGIPFDGKARIEGQSARVRLGSDLGKWLVGSRLRLLGTSRKPRPLFSGPKAHA